MTDNSLTSDAYDNSLCIEKVIQIAAFMDKLGRGCDDYEDFLESIEFGQVLNVPTSLQHQIDIVKTEEIEIDAEFLCELISECKTHDDCFVVRYDTPVRTYDADGRSYSSSWGHSAFVWVWGTSLQDCAVTARKWLRDRTTVWKSEARIGAAV